MSAIVSALVGGALACTACGVADEQNLPPDVPDPASVRTATGAVAFYRNTVATFVPTFAELTTESGVFTDELAALSLPPMMSSYYTGLDSRSLTIDDPIVAPYYRELHLIRAQAREARGFLRSYASDSSPALRGHLYAVEGYAEILLADHFCSGIPLSTVDFGADFTLTRGFTTAEVYTHAVALFDTAFALTTDSSAFQHLAGIGRGRALLALGRYAEAAASVAAVPDNYRHRIVVERTAAGGISRLQQFGTNYNGTDVNPKLYSPGTPSVAEREGMNGLPYRSSGDPRSAADPLGPDRYGNTMYFPTKYPIAGSTTVVLASGVEARLIQAEAALSDGDATTWLTTLNTLRTSGISVIPADTIADTLGVTGCGPASVCGDSPGGSDPWYGQPLGGFPVPAGYAFASSYTIAPVSAQIRDHCWNYSWYAPCYDNEITTVNVYVRPEQTTWVAGSGGVVGLPLLTDPGSASARLDLMFRERAFWLYLTAHRQGDLRRLIRNYGRPPEVVYPVGPYPGGAGQYGPAVTFPVPSTERTFNPNYSGCIHQNA